jgi:hypothetical protein
MAVRSSWLFQLQPRIILELMAQSSPLSWINQIVNTVLSRPESAPLFLVW